MQQDNNWPNGVYTLSYDGTACAAPYDVVGSIAFSHHITGSTLKVVNGDGEVMWSMGGTRSLIEWSAVSSVAVGTAAFHFEAVHGGAWCDRAAFANVALQCALAPPAPSTSPPPPTPKTNHYGEGEKGEGHATHWPLCPSLCIINGSNRQHIDRGPSNS